MSTQQDPPSGRAAFLPVMLAALGGFFFLLVLILITGGFFLYIVLFFAGVGALTWFHWIVWGKLLTQLTAGEREEEELLQRAREQEDQEHITTRR